MRSILRRGRCTFVLAAVLSPAVGHADGCQLARDVAVSVASDQLSSTEKKLSQMLAVFPPHGCVAPNYRLQLGILQFQIPDKRDMAEKHFKKSVQQANKQDTVLRAHSLAWYSRAKWEAVSQDWSIAAQEAEQSEAYKEARNAKHIYNLKYPGQELHWFDDYLLEMVEQLKNPSVLAIAAQLDVHTISRDAVATAASNSVELRIGFEQNSDSLTSSGLATIGRLLSAVERLQHREGSLQLEIVGHTSTEGSHSYNQDLSLRRAQAVKSAIVGHQLSWLGDVSASGRGENEPMYPRESRELMRRANRRVEVKLIGTQ